MQVHVTDPHANSDELNHEYGFCLTPNLANNYDAVIIAVPHLAYMSMDDEAFVAITKTDGIIADVKGVYRDKIKSRKYWSL